MGQLENAKGKRPMKVLSIRQPWAWLIVQGIKDIENRTWRTKFRGQFLVHASLKFDKEGYRAIQRKHFVYMPQPHEFDRGCVVGYSMLVDCVEEHKSPWMGDAFGFVLTESHPLLTPIPLKGKLGFFDYVG
jgi:hypothetical protein